MPASGRKLKILHVFRAPLGGLFRHVYDVVDGQIARGHSVGIIAETRKHGAYPEGLLAKLQPKLKLGLTRIPISRHVGIRDISAIRHVTSRIIETDADVAHGHGAKGGAFVRLAATGHRAIRAYTPHGGSLLYLPGTLASKFYVTIERMLMPRTDLFLFESDFVSSLYRQKVGIPKGVVRVVCNGVGPDEFQPVAPIAGATDLLFIGELRPIKGVDVLLEAIAELRRKGLPLTATIVGDGPSRVALQEHAKRLALDDLVNFRLPMPARQAFAHGRLMVVPSRGESLPYIVLEVAAAQLPLIATRTGGIPEIFGPQSDLLVTPGDRPALVAAIEQAIKNPQTIQAAARVLQERVRSVFSIENMIDGVLAGYAAALEKPVRSNPS